MARPAPLQTFIDRVRQALDAPGLGAREALARDHIFAALAAREGLMQSPSPAELPVCAELPRAAAIAGRGPAPVARLAEAIVALSPALNWARRRTAKAGDEPFYSGHANATVVGEGGLEQRSDVTIGMTVMAPHVLYPDHNHPPEEVYISLAGGEWWNAERPWTEPGQGGFFYNPPGILHAMRTTGQPMLAVWCLWSG